MPLRAGGRSGGDTQGRAELPEDVLPVLQSTNQGAVPLLRMDSGAAAEGRHLCGGPPTSSTRRKVIPTGASMSAHPGRVRAQFRVDQLRHEPALCPQAVPHVPKDDGTLPATSGPEDYPREPRTGPQGRLRGVGRGPPPALLSEVKESGFLDENEADDRPLCRRKRRQIKEALRKAERRWHNLFSLLNLPAISGCPSTPVTELDLDKAIASKSAKRVRDLTGMAPKECQLLVGEEAEPSRGKTVNIAWVNEPSSDHDRAATVEEINQCRPDLLVIHVKHVTRAHEDQQAFMRSCQPLDVPAVLLRPDRSTAVRDNNSIDQRLVWSTDSPELDSALQQVCPDGLMKCSAVRLVGAAAALIFATAADQIYQYYLWSPTREHESRCYFLQQALQWPYRRPRKPLPWPKES